MQIRITRDLLIPAHFVVDIIVLMDASAVVDLWISNRFAFVLVLVASLVLLYVEQSFANFQILQFFHQVVSIGKTVGFDVEIDEGKT